MKSKHTPGPWSAEIVGVTGPDDDLDDLYEINNGFTRIAEHVAPRDAHLIAAAPEMFLALKAMHACHRAFSGAENWTALDDEARAAAESAIAKAEGHNHDTKGT
jgi:hypothetical protein